MLVGITAQKVRHHKYKEIGFYLDQKWQVLSVNLGIKLIILNSLNTAKELINNRTIKAVILSGGGQLSSSFPNGKYKKHFFKKNIDTEREAIEIELIDFAISSKTPLIGICRGMQAIGKYFGGKLSPIKGHVNTKHKLNYFCPIIKKQINRTVNSYHDYGFKVSKTPKQFLINATYKDIVEQFVHKNKKILGLMWHPEREKKFNNFDLELFQNFFNN